MKWFIKPETDREAEIWDSGWRCGLSAMFAICLIVTLIVYILTL